MTVLPEGLEDIARILACWSAPAPSSIVYLFGSRVRGDNRPDSDVDFHIHCSVRAGDRATAEWVTRQHETWFADLRPLLPGPPGFLDPQDKETVALVMNGKVIFEHRNVRCIWLPPKAGEKRGV